MKVPTKNSSSKAPDSEFSGFSVTELPGFLFVDHIAIAVNDVEESVKVYKEALAMAQRNLKVLADRGVRIAMGTDSGPAARFQGYFEHGELDLMAEAGLSPMQILGSATNEAARCLQIDDKIGNGQFLIFFKQQRLHVGAQRLFCRALISKGFSFWKFDLGSRLLHEEDFDVVFVRHAIAGGGSISGHRV